MNSNIFFKKKNIKLKKLFPDYKFKENFVVESVKPLVSAKKKDITFFDSLKYKEHISKTKAIVCITSQKLEKFLPDHLIKIIVKTFHYKADLENILVGTTRWILEDKSGDILGLAKSIGGVPLLATQLNFSKSCYEQLQVYEKGYVKEGMGAGACAVASSISYNLTEKDLLSIVENLLKSYYI